MMRVDKKEVKMKFQIMPPKPGTCPECGVKHPPCSGDVEFESGLWATTCEEAMVEALSSLNAEVLEVEDDERP